MNFDAILMRKPLVADTNRDSMLSALFLVPPRRRIHGLGLFVLTALSLLLMPAAQHLPMDARTTFSTRVPFLSTTDVSLWRLGQARQGKDNSTTHKLASVPLVQQVAAVGMTVSDMDRSVEFYSKVLSFEKVSDVEVAGEDFERLQGVFGVRMRVVRMCLGTEFIELTEYLAPKGRPFPIDSRGNDRWFQHIAIITSDMDKAYAWLRANKVEHASTGPQRLPDWNKNAAGIKAFYFRDPDRHYLEILQFPEGKGDPKWQQTSGKLFMGIDHTAIVVANTEESLAFYRDLLGLNIAGTSENFGVEQEHLNNVFGAHLRITSLRASGGGPGIEFLEYLSPKDGRTTPADERANDLVHWQTSLVVSDTKVVEQHLRAQNSRLVSPGSVALSDTRIGFSSGLLVRDPDGHVMQLIQK